MSRVASPKDEKEKKKKKICFSSMHHLQHASCGMHSVANMMTKTLKLPEARTGCQARLHATFCG
jgi:hypothetical protein